MPVNAVHPNRSLSSKSVVRACKMKPAKWSVGGILSIYMKKNQKDLDYNIEVQARNAIGEENLSRAALSIVYDTKIGHFPDIFPSCGKYC